MMQIPVYNLDNKQVGTQEINPSIFAQETREDILYRVTHWQMAKARSGCHKAKQRNEVSGSTRKIYKQKGTGQARHGSIKAPIFIGGGIVFGPVVRSHAYSLNKKIRNLGLKIALSLKLAQNSFIVLDSAQVDNPKTSEMNNKLKNFNIKSALFIDSNIENNFKKSVSNLKHIDVLPVIGLNVLDILKHEKIFITVDAMKNIEERLA